MNWIRLVTVCLLATLQELLAPNENWHANGFSRPEFASLGAYRPLHERRDFSVRELVLQPLEFLLERPVLSGTVRGLRRRTTACLPDVS